MFLPKTISFSHLRYSYPLTKPRSSSTAAPHKLPLPVSCTVSVLSLDTAVPVLRHDVTRHREEAPSAGARGQVEEVNNVCVRVASARAYAPSVTTRPRLPRDATIDGEHAVAAHRVGYSSYAPNRKLDLRMEIS